MYKVFINDRVMLLTGNFDDYHSEYDTLFTQYQDAPTLYSLIDLLKISDAMKRLVVYHPNADELFKLVADHYGLVRTCGGVVKSDKGQILFIKKRGRWDLPKGKVETGESNEETALREVKEECGLKELKITGNLGSTYYFFEQNDKMVLKENTWFSMQSNETGPFSGDAKEEITDVIWMDKAALEAVKDNSYPSVLELAKASF